MRRLVALMVIGLAATPAAAQTAAPTPGQPGPLGGSSSAPSSGSRSMGSLIANGYEIKASSPTGNRFVVFLQKEGSAYACEFVTLSNSRCGEID
jgi:hypothetical protein